MITARSQRWRERRARFVPSASIINPAAYAVDVIDCGRLARPFIEQHHYSGTFPASRMSVGLFECAEKASRLVGVATFSQPMNNRVVPVHTGLAAGEGAELGRFVLLDSVAGNGETFFLSRALRLLRQEKPKISAIVSYADPAERRDDAGQIVKPGHIGGIYQAMSAAYRGRGVARTQHQTPDGQIFSGRAASKIQNYEQGFAYAVDQLVRAGAPRPSASADLREWYAGLLASGFLTRRRHPGNHVYAFALTRAARMAGRSLRALPYPRDASADRQGTEALA
ncbi:hypothetical protein V8J38_16940 (plasmid) [Brevundimonas olei]|uniref:GNAT family N-acetyltransferase n=1 Tax=Brevundimonas olei TaxID=657642 RepID=A0ABZ2IG20_9CAUL